MAEYVATLRPVAGVILVSGALPLDMLGVDAWPAGVPAQIHLAQDDPFLRHEWLDALVAEVRAASQVEVFRYPVAGHLFTDASLPAEYDARASEQLWERVVRFVHACRGIPARVAAGG